MGTKYWQHGGVINSLIDSSEKENEHNVSPRRLQNKHDDSRKSGSESIDIDNAENRQLVEAHTIGRKSFAQIGEGIKAEKKMDPKMLAPKDDIYDKTRKRKPGRVYKEMVDKRVCEKMSKVVAKLGEINSDFKYLDVEELCLASGDESEEGSDHEQQDDRADDNAHEADDENDD